MGRSAIPKHIQERLMKEYKHCCALCDTQQPQIHHIDGNSDNNDSLNLIPLCPNCHFNKIHNTNSPIDQGIITLFKKYKNKSILDKKFIPIHKRLLFLIDFNNNINYQELKSNVKDLLNFISKLDENSYYTDTIQDLSKEQAHFHVSVLGDPESERSLKRQYEEEEVEYINQINDNRVKIVELCIELLHYQNW